MHIFNDAGTRLHSNTKTLTFVLYCTDIPSDSARFDSFPLCSNRPSTLLLLRTPSFHILLLFETLGG